MILIMARAPLPGRCKTRLHGRLGPRGAARVQRELLQRLVRLLPAADCELHAAPDIRHPSFLAARRAGFRLRRQIGPDLGARMRRAQASRPAVLIGTDCPGLTAEMIASARAQVASGSGVIIPALDGGYVLLGLPANYPAAFRGIRWGSSRVLGQTRRQLRLYGLNLRETRPLADLDTPFDFATERRAGRLKAF